MPDVTVWCVRQLRAEATAVLAGAERELAGDGWSVQRRAGGLTAHLASGVATLVVEPEPGYFGWVRVTHRLDDSAGSDAALATLNRSQARVDAGLATLDPTSAAGFAPPAVVRPEVPPTAPAPPPSAPRPPPSRSPAPSESWSERHGMGGAQQSVEELTARATSALTHAAELVDLAGAMSKVTGTLSKLKSPNHVRLVGAKGSAILTEAECRSWLAVAAPITATPGSLPDKLRDQLDAFTARLDEVLEVDRPVSQLDLRDSELPVASSSTCRSPYGTACPRGCCSAARPAGPSAS